MLKLRFWSYLRNIFFLVLTYSAQIKNRIYLKSLKKTYWAALPGSLDKVTHKGWDCNDDSRTFPQNLFALQQFFDCFQVWIYVFYELWQELYCQIPLISQVYAVSEVTFFFGYPVNTMKIIYRDILEIKIQYTCEVLKVDLTINIEIYIFFVIFCGCLYFVKYFFF